MSKSSYGAATEEIIQLFSQYFSGSSSRPFLAICFHDLGDSAEDALSKSLAALGYPDPSYSVVCISPDDAPAPLDPAALRLLVEGIDPYRLICADEESMKILDDAYGIKLVPRAVNRVEGRSAGVFANLDADVRDAKTKYVVWEILKALK